MRNRKDSPATNYKGPDEKKVPKGNRVVKDVEDTQYVEKEFDSSYNDVSRAKETSEQPVHPIKKAPKK